MSVEMFDRLLEQHGDSPKALDWSNEGQKDRFRVLRELGIKTTSTILDVGCGLGHFYDYMKMSHGVVWGAYHGIDASARLVETARARLAKHASVVTFEVRDALDSRMLPPAQYVVSSGMLNVAQEAPSHQSNFRAWLRMQTLIRKCFEASQVACAINMLSIEAPMKRIDRVYYIPARVAYLAATLTKRFMIRHDYRDNDFTLYLYKDKP